jgi:hypothetical protein
MAGRLKNIVDYVKSRVHFKNLAVACLNLKAGMNVDDFREKTPDNPELEQKLIQGAKEILGVDHLDIPF